MTIDPNSVREVMDWGSFNECCLVHNLIDEYKPVRLKHARSKAAISVVGTMLVVVGGENKHFDFVP